jgi:hypothetical protein
VYFDLACDWLHTPDTMSRAPVDTGLGGQTYP